MVVVVYFPHFLEVVKIDFFKKILMFIGNQALICEGWLWLVISEFDEWKLSPTFCIWCFYSHFIDHIYLVQNYGAVEPHDLTVASEKAKDAPGMDIILEIDRTMSKYTENLMHTLEGVSARLSQMETRTRHLENSVDDLKVTVGNNHGSTDGKLRHLENILREVSLLFIFSARN